ncbi:TonB-dependent receptor [Chryseobacterium sp. CT-SW4]|uniref:TonB-dependent receptor n=1 Tax=Chryseobacterium sp. SW-1 TaxID=3157343 RepID=UPI003B02C944
MARIAGLLFLLSITFVFSQEKDEDSATLISEVQIDAYKKPSTFITSTKSVSVVSKDLLEQNTPERMLESVNQIGGVRMEERSPGSYRISVRGSTLRSPFGVRNVKVYLDDFILSDASGNTYFNILSPELIRKIEIYKGPESGDYGAMTGGAFLLKTGNSENLSLNLSMGSYGMFNQSFDFSKQSGKHFFEIFQNYYRTDSYREQSAVERKQVFLKDRFEYSKKGTLHAMLLISDLKYETPGGLTLEQMQADRKQSRPATAVLPGALEQNAGIRNKMILGGLSHQLDISPEFSHFIMVQGSYVDLRNPFITNFEKRFENNAALRTHFNYKKTWSQLSMEWRLGFEGGINSVTVRNYDNNGGITGAPQNFDHLKNLSGFYFVSQKLNFKEKLFTDISLSLNSNTYQWDRSYPSVQEGKVRFKDQWLPNFGITYLLGKGVSLRGKIGKGNSAPTNEEMRSSDQQFNVDLLPEYGWNKEIGLRKQLGNMLFLEGSYFDFRMNNTIVRRQNEQGQEFFVNQGNSVQRGLEALVESRSFTIPSSWWTHFKFRLSGSFYHFRFKDYSQDDKDYSENNLTGVPATTVNSLLSFVFFKKLSVDYSHFYTSRTPLNDANSVWSESSLVGNIQFRVPVKIEKTRMDIHLQVQNLYNTDYVSGFDINAFGNRFYNPAAKRNYNLGISVKF